MVKRQRGESSETAEQTNVLRCDVALLQRQRGESTETAEQTLETVVEVHRGQREVGDVAVGEGGEQQIDLLLRLPVNVGKGNVGGERKEPQVVLEALVLIGRIESRHSSQLEPRDAFQRLALAPEEPDRFLGEHLALEPKDRRVGL
eukprot:Amastigsp_a1301_13.p8 type:complete len:146 gc:universal Amastigsp_a1301_13:849-412(-)